MWQILAVLLALALVVALVRHRLLRRELGRMAAGMEAIRGQETNRQLTIGFQDGGLARLATAINAQYDDVDRDRAAHRTAMDEMRQSMADISHDLRTPLTSVLGYLKLLRKGGNTPAQAEHYLGVACARAESLNRLVGGLFELSRLESGGYVFDHQRLDAAAALGEELAATYAQFEAGGELPAVELAEDPLWVVGDAGALGRVFANILQNMLRHGRAPMAVCGGREGEEVVFRFSNRAPGLTQEDVSQLFGRFFTGDRMRSGENTGLGLTIVREFTGQMGGRIEAELEEGTLTFTLCWPAAL